MTKKEFRNIIIQIVIVMLVAVWIALTYDSVDEPHTESSIPPRPLLKGPQIYDFDSERWRPLFYIPEENEPDNRKYFTEEELDKYLQEHVEGYLEDTYWGEEYDLDY